MATKAVPEESFAFLDWARGGENVAWFKQRLLQTFRTADWWPRTVSELPTRSRRLTSTIAATLLIVSGPMSGLFVSRWGSCSSSEPGLRGLRSSTWQGGLD